MEEQTRIKICGLTRLEDIDAVNELKPEYVGFVFAKSRRQITKEHAVTLRRYLDPEIQAVGVFVNELPAIVAGYLEEGVIDLAQLHGNESEVIYPFAPVPHRWGTDQGIFHQNQGERRKGEKKQRRLHPSRPRKRRYRRIVRLVTDQKHGPPVFPCGRPERRKCGTGDFTDTSLRRRHQQRCRDRRRKGPEKNHRMHKEDKTCLTEDLVFTEASTYRKL